MIKFFTPIVVFCGLGSLGLFLPVNDSSVDVTDQTLKISGNSEEVMYFGFAEGDKIIFNFSEVDNKELKEIEILEYPSNSKFSDFKTSKIENKIIQVTKKSVYKFRFNNTAIKGRVCKIKIQRIPANEQTKNFNTSIVWTVKQDTTWNLFEKNEIVGYDTLYIPKTKRELVKTVQKEELLLDKNQRVHSQTNENGNKSEIFFTLPQNTTTAYQSSRVISWAYWVGVGEEASNAWAQNVRAVGNLAKGVATVYTTPLGALAVGAMTELAIPKLGEDIDYSIADQINRDLFWKSEQYRVYDSGKGIASYKKFIGPGLLQGQFFILMKNDNYVQGVDVSVKVVAIVETKTFEDKNYTEIKINPKYEKRYDKVPVLTLRRVPATSE